MIPAIPRPSSGSIPLLAARSGAVSVKETDFFVEYGALGLRVFLFNRDAYPSFVEEATFKIDGHTRLSNFFDKKEHDAQKRAERFNQWIRGPGRVNKGAQDELLKMWKALRQYGRVGLECHCYPRPCHGTVIALLLLEWAHFERARR